MKLTPILILSGALLSTAAVVKADDRTPFGNGALPEFLKPYDTDGDGKLSAEERQAAAAALKDAREQHKEDRKHPWDADGDGKLSPEEIAAAQEAVRAKIEEQRTARFNELDEDDDGFLSKEEFAPPAPLPPGGIDRVFSHLDKDKDGKISKEEFLGGLRPPGGVRPPQPPPPPPPPPRPGDGTPPAGGR